MEDIDSDFPYTKRSGTEGKGTDLSDEALKDDDSKKNPHCSKSLNIKLSWKNKGKRGENNIQSSFLLDQKQNDILWHQTCAFYCLN